MSRVLMLASVASMIDQFNMPNIRLLLELGNQVHVACNFKEGSTCDRKRIQKLQKRLARMRVIWHQWDCPRTMDSVWACVAAYRQLLGLTARYRFDWMHCHSPIGGALARIAAHQRKIRVVYTAHGFHFYEGAPWKNWLLYYPVEKLLSYWTDVLITVNQEDDRFARKNFRAGRICRIPGVGIDTKEYFRQQTGTGDVKTAIEKARFCKKYQIPEHAVILLSVGELSIRKNHQIVLSALAGLYGTEVYYVICGLGECREHLRRQAEALGIGQRVIMPGYQENIRVFYKMADVFVLPSLQEGLSVALMEAMAAGLPCVVSDIRGNRELIDDLPGCHRQGGIRYAPGGMLQLRKALEQMIRDKQLRISCGNYNKCKIRQYDQSVTQLCMRTIYMWQDALQNAELTERVLYKKRKSGNESRQKHIPEISVIMSVYNTQEEQVLSAAIDSIRNQTFQDWEFLICDDGSTDQTWKILQAITANDPRIRLLHYDHNRKAGYARNTCIKVARGNYIAVMDADDISAPDRLEKEYNYLEQHPETAFAGCIGEFFTNLVGDDGERYWFCEHPRPEDFLFSLPFVHASILFRKQALWQAGGYDSSKRAVRVEDYDLLLRLYRMGYCGSNLPQVMYYIRRDQRQYRRRKYRYRFLEAVMKYRNFKNLGLFPKGLLYAAKPLIVGLLPVRLTVSLQKKRAAVSGAALEIRKSIEEHEECKK